MILTDYYKAEKLTEAKTRFDVTASTGGYDLFERLLINKKGVNIGGLSFNLIQRPDYWKGKKYDLAITKGNHNITSIKRPNIEVNTGFGDINGTNDACIIIFNPDFKEAGITSIEIFIARGVKHDALNVWYLFTDGEFNDDINELKKITSTIPVFTGLV